MRVSTFIVAGAYSHVCYIKSIKNQVVFIMALPIQRECVLLEAFSDVVFYMKV